MLPSPIDVSPIRRDKAQCWLGGAGAARHPEAVSSGFEFLGRGGINVSRHLPFPGPGAARGEDIRRIHVHVTAKRLDLKLRSYRAVIGQMKAVHNVSTSIGMANVGIAHDQLPFARVVAIDVGLGGACQPHLKVRGLLVGKEPIEDMIALVRAGCRHVDAVAGIAVEVAAYDPEQGDGTNTVELVERIEVALAILSGAES